MLRPFWSATAEQVVTAVEAVGANRLTATADYVADFSDVPRDQAEAALSLATDMDLLSENGGAYSAVSPLCRFFSTPKLGQKAATLRVILESYEPFLVFREQLYSTNSATIASRQTKAVLDFEPHYGVIRDTMISLGTYSQCFTVEVGGQYGIDDSPLDNTLDVLARGCRDATSAEGRIREQLGEEVFDKVSRTEVFERLGIALLHANDHDREGAVRSAGTAVESFLDELAGRSGVNTGNAHSINSKLDRFSANQDLPNKILSIGRYLGHIRNAASHGPDPETGSSWNIRQNTGLEYVYVACSFISSCVILEQGETKVL